MSPKENILFVGTSSSPQCWYRCALPARALGADWIGADGPPTAPVIRTGQAGRRLASVDDFATYDIVVLQIVLGREWERAIRELRARGVTVLYEIDDYAHGIRKAKGHAFAAKFDKEFVAKIERAMRACDGIICSTDYIATRYRAFNANVWVCQNGVDLGRYALTRPARDTVTIGWSGGTGHGPALSPWLRELPPVMDAHPELRLMTIGDRGNLKPFAQTYGEERAIELGWSAIEVYPSAMVNFDIALAPATNSAFFRGKSDLRWLEASALGIPVVANPVLYPQIEHGVTGLHASTPAEARAAIEVLVDDAAMRTRIGEAAQAYVREHRSSAAVAPQWKAVFDDVRRVAEAA